MTRVYKVELMIVDHDELGGAGIKAIIENTSYPNRCIAPVVIGTPDSRDVEWKDGHPLNDRSKRERAFRELWFR